MEKYESISYKWCQPAASCSFKCLYRGCPDPIFAFSIFRCYLAFPLERMNIETTHAAADSSAIHVGNMFIQIFRCCCWSSFSFFYRGIQFHSDGAKYEVIPYTCSFSRSTIGGRRQCMWKNTSLRHDGVCMWATARGIYDVSTCDIQLRIIS